MSDARAAAAVAATTGGVAAAGGTAARARPRAEASVTNRAGRYWGSHGEGLGQVPLWERDLPAPVAWCRELIIWGIVACFVLLIWTNPGPCPRNSEGEVSGSGVYTACYDFHLRSMSPGLLCSCSDALNTHQQQTAAVPSTHTPHQRLRPRRASYAWFTYSTPCTTIHRTTCSTTAVATMMPMAAVSQTVWRGQEHTSHASPAARVQRP